MPTYVLESHTYYAPRESISIQPGFISWFVNPVTFAAERREYMPEISPAVMQQIFVKVCDIIRGMPDSRLRRAEVLQDNNGRAGLRLRAAANADVPLNTDISQLPVVTLVVQEQVVSQPRYERMLEDGFTACCALCGVSSTQVRLDMWSNEPYAADDMLCGLCRENLQSIHRSHNEQIRAGLWGEPTGSRNFHEAGRGIFMQHATNYANQAQRNASTFNVVYPTA